MPPTYEFHKLRFDYLMEQMTETLNGMSAEAGETSPRVHVIEGLRAEGQVFLDRLKLQHDWVVFRYRGEVRYDPDTCRHVRNYMKIWLKQVNNLVVVRFGLGDVE